MWKNVSQAKMQQEKLFSFNLLNVVTEDLQYYYAVTSQYW